MAEIKMNDKPAAELEQTAREWFRIGQENADGSGAIYSFDEIKKRSKGE